MSWEKKELILPDGTNVLAQIPVIISASRATDIPAFYGDWLVNRIKAGYVKWKNPFNGVPLYVSFENTRLIVFWTKNPEPFLKHLSFFDEFIPDYYFQYTLNDYEDEGLEPGLPALEKRIDTFIRLSEQLGKERVIWRFDPLILSDKVKIGNLLDKIERIGNRLHSYTEKLVFSFADIHTYRKVQNNLRRNNIHSIEFDEKAMNEFARGLQQLNQQWNLQLATCAEPVALEKYGIHHNRCIDDELVIRLFSHNKELMDFLQGKNRKDRGQRIRCGCIMSKDIGAYNTCPHGCIYCYANNSGNVCQNLLQ